MSSKFTIKLEGKIFSSDEYGMLDLNDIWRGCDLSESKRPSEWKGKIKDNLKLSDNIRSVTLPRVSGKTRAQKTTIGSEKATVAYAMWVSFDFYNLVIDSFIALRNGEIQKAVALAGETMSEEDAFYLKRQARLKGMLWDDACAWAGIKHPRNLKKFLHNHERFDLFDENNIVKEDDFKANTLFYNRGNKFTSNVRLCVTPEGRDWLRHYRGWFEKELINSKTEG